MSMAKPAHQQSVTWSADDHDDIIHRIMGRGVYRNICAGWGLEKPMSDKPVMDLLDVVVINKG